MSGRRSTHHDLPEDVLDPRLLPADLLRSPGTWLPSSSGIDPSALQKAHPDLRGEQDLLSSGRLADILDIDIVLAPAVDLVRIVLGPFLVRPGLQYLGQCFARVTWRQF